MTPLGPGWDRGCTMPDASSRQSRYGVAYLSHVCAQYGVPMTENRADEDFNAVDVTLQFSTGDIRVQVKCMTADFTVRDPHVRVPITTAWAEKWRVNQNPVFLVVVKVPGDPAEWVDYDTDHETLHRTAAYWARIDCLPSPAPSGVNVQFSNMLTPETVRDWNQMLYSGYTQTTGGPHVANTTP